MLVFGGSSRFGGTKRTCAVPLEPRTRGLLFPPHTWSLVVSEACITTLSDIELDPRWNVQHSSPTTDCDNGPQARENVRSRRLLPALGERPWGSEHPSARAPSKQPPLPLYSLEFLSSGLDYFEKGCQIHRKDWHFYSWLRIWLKEALYTNQYTQETIPS